MSVPFFRVNAFTSSPFAGNPAGICVLDTVKESPWMQKVARELALPITSFVAPGSGRIDLRWFSPAAEVPLCGHGALAAAHVMWEVGAALGDNPVTFATSGGPVTARRRTDGQEATPTIALDLPAVETTDWPEAPDLTAVLGVPRVRAGLAGDDLLVELADEADVRAVEPDLPAIAALDRRGVIVTAASSSQRFDIVSRFFAPGIGVDEDAVTGSAHCALGPYWCQRFDLPRITAFQASPRGGVVGVQVRGDRVTLWGEALTVMVGTLKL